MFIMAIFLLPSSIVMAGGNEGLQIQKESVRPCTQQDQLYGLCKKAVDVVVCATFFNPNYETIDCDFTATAWLIELATGFTKRVRDIRNEKIYFNSEVQICFNFGKDIYHLWKINELAEPKVECSGPSGPKTCDVSQGGCGEKPIIDRQTPLDPAFQDPTAHW
jgi:hypothetical protein